MISPATPKLIAVLLEVDFDFSMQVLQGVQRYAHREQSWQLLPLHGTQEELFYSFLRQNLLTGVIGALLSDRWLKGLPGKPVPMVNISDQSQIHSVSSVISDNRHVGRLAAHHLLQQGHQTFGALFEKASASAVHRYEGFSEVIAAAGFSVATPPSADSYAFDAGWEGWLRQLPRPSGLFCSSDYLARRLMRRIRSLAAEIPRDFAVVGVGNAPVDNLLAHVPLTSIQLDGTRIGERAAACLASLLDHPEQPPHVERIKPTQLVPRASSVKNAGEDPLVAKVIAQQELTQSITGARLAKLCGASKRTVEMRFKKAMGCGPATALRKRRIEHAALLLRDTELSLEAIAEATGFANPAGFSAAFRKAHGAPPGAWRKKHQTISMQSP
jgi:LacI family transcriptional regulator